MKNMTPHEVLEDFMNNPQDYETGGRVVAEAEEFGVTITVDGLLKFGSLFPEITVFGDDDLWFDEVAYSEKEFLDLLEEAYETFLTPQVFAAVTDDDTPPPPKESFEELDEEEIVARESELTEAVRDFAAVVYDRYITDEEGIEDLKEALLDACADFDPDIYRPSEWENENGDIVPVRYPYVE